MIARPQPTTQTATARPTRRTRPTWPVSSDPIRAPSPGAAFRYPTVVAPPWNTVSAIAGNSARGIPNIIAPRSMRNAPASGPLDRRYRIPPMSEASPAGCPAALGPKRRQPGHGDERHREGDDVQPVDQREPGVGDEQAGGGRADDQGHLERGRLKRQRGGELTRGHQLAQRRAPGRPVHALERGGLDGAGEHRPQPRVPEHRVDGQPGGPDREQHLGDQHDLAPVPGVHHRAARAANRPAAAPAGPG